MDIVNLIALVLALVYTLRKMEVQRREPDMYPQVPAEEFKRWKHKALKAYNISSLSCVVKLAADLAFWYLYAKQSFAIPVVVFAVGGTIFLAWVAALLVGALLAGSSRKLRLELGIDLRARVQ
jgi:hypothetical protein